MPTYEFECSACQVRKAVTTTWAERPASLTCPLCQGTAEPVISINTNPPIVKGFEYHFDRSKVVGNNGKKYGRSAYTQAQHYGRMFTERMKQEREKQRSLSRRAPDDGWEFVGGMPGEMHDSIVEQEGDKNVVLQDPVPFLKSTGLYCGKD